MYQTKTQMTSCNCCTLCSKKESDCLCNTIIQNLNQKVSHLTHELQKIKTSSSKAEITKYEKAKDYCQCCGLEISKNGECGC